MKSRYKSAVTDGGEARTVRELQAVWLLGIPKNTTTASVVVNSSFET
jgi:hypothetical protein